MIRLASRISRVSNLKRAFATYPQSWDKLARKELGGNGPESLEWKSPENITIKPLYTPNDLDSSFDINKAEAPGCFPFKRGPYATMYTAKP